MLSDGPDIQRGGTHHSAPGAIKGHRGTPPASLDAAPRRPNVLRSASPAA
jgi:hypothetical protein